MNWGYAVVTLSMFPLAAMATMASPVIRANPRPHLVILAALYVALALGTAVPGSPGAAFGICASLALVLTVFLFGRGAWLLVTGRYRRKVSRS